MNAAARVIAPLAAALALLAPSTALAHGGGGGSMSEKAQMAELSKQPARVLAQQAIAALEIRGDRADAALRLDAALESKDKRDIDVALLRKATETLDGGDPKGAVPLLDRALSRPLGAQSGKALHEAGRSFEPGTGAQEVVGIALGGALLILAGAGFWLTHRRRQRDARPA